MEHVVYLLLIVVHLNQLGPELPKDACEPRWQDGPEFKSDYMFSREAALSMLPLMVERYPRFISSLEDAENGFRKLCEGIEVRLKTTGEAFLGIKVECLCGKHAPSD